MSVVRRVAWTAVVGALGLGWLSGCESPPMGPGEIPQPARPVEGWNRPLPPWAEIAKTYNARLVGLDRLRAPVTVVVEAPDGHGGRRKDQLEGNLQVILPDRVALRLDKVGQTVFQVGCDPTKYWSLDFTGEPVALVGLHSKLGPRSAARLGVPVHPFDLIDLLAITPLPASGGKGTRVEWSRGRDLMIVTLPARAGSGASRRLTLDAKSMYPTRVELLDAKGGILATGDLSRYVTVELPGVAISRTRIAERYEVVLPGEDARVTLSVYDPKNPGGSMRAQAFDFEALCTAYGVAKVYDLDRPAPGGTP
ncbi:MAG: hypothetical protein DYG92_01190 [Leptolyngbya sp. PLA1]|nr:hypothetical protein [Leptolyngbya sp. PLA1]